MKTLNDPPLHINTVRFCRPTPLSRPLTLSTTPTQHWLLKVLVSTTKTHSTVHGPTIKHSNTHDSWQQSLRLLEMFSRNSFSGYSQPFLPRVLDGLHKLNSTLSDLSTGLVFAHCIRCGRKCRNEILTVIIVKNKLPWRIVKVRK